MLTPFFTLAAVSPGRQRTFRALVIAHLAVLAAAALMVPTLGAAALGHTLLVAGIVEGALLLGWRLTQLPKSQALEFLLVSPVRPWQFFLAEALVGFVRLALVNLAGLPILLLLMRDGALLDTDVLILLVMPITWGLVTGLGLIVWAYEPAHVRRIGERVVFVLIVLYLVVGVLAGEHLRAWLAWLPGDAGRVVMTGFEAMHRYSPFAVLQQALTRPLDEVLTTLLTLEGLALAGCVGLTIRGACRLQGHFHDRHYLPSIDLSGGKRQPVGEKPLRWWAVKRVGEYSGRVNLWLAGGFGLLYAAYTLAGTDWPPWLGRAVFEIFDRMGGPAGLAAGLVVLAAVPAAYQYGLWDASAQDRCRRLELLLLTRLEGRDYWEAAAAAAWRRGRGYFAVAVLLWLAALVGGQMGPAQALGALSAGVILWGLYFVIGFRAFASGAQANLLGMALTVGLPLLTVALALRGWPALAGLLPPGTVYQAATAPILVGPLLGGMAALTLARVSRAHCEAGLRAWYDRHHGQKVVD